MAFDGQHSVRRANSTNMACASRPCQTKGRVRRGESCLALIELSSSFARLIFCWKRARIIGIFFGTPTELVANFKAPPSAEASS
jgi:hypothetical protein